MKLLILIFSIFTLNSFSFGSNMLSQADSAYSNQNYSDAISKYSQLIADQNQSSALYYNLGNAYFKNNELGKAIWAYQKANKIKPGQADIVYNLDLTSNLTKDKIEQRKDGISKWISKIFYARSINFWAWLSVFIVILICITYYLYRTSSLKNMKNLFLMFSISFTVLMLITISIGFAQYKHITTLTNGVITSPVVKVRTAPNSNESVAFELHEGAKFDWLKSEQDWLNININKNQGWILKEDALLY